MRVKGTDHNGTGLLTADRNCCNDGQMNECHRCTRARDVFSPLSLLHCTGHFGPRHWAFIGGILAARDPVVVGGQGHARPRWIAIAALVVVDSPWLAARTRCICRGGPYALMLTVI